MLAAPPGLLSLKGIVMFQWNISTGELYHPSGNMVWSGYAGFQQFANDPAAVMMKSRGPLPPGVYTLGKAVIHPRLGPQAIPLVPDEGNVMFGRSGFYIHGDNSRGDRSGSHGCIILPRAARNMLATSPVRQIKVVP
nr:MAG: hypothetical protein [Microvirus sp.]